MLGRLILLWRIVLWRCILFRLINWRLLLRRSIGSLIKVLSINCGLLIEILCSLLLESLLLGLSSDCVVDNWLGIIAVVSGSIFTLSKVFFILIWICNLDRITVQVVLKCLCLWVYLRGDCLLLLVYRVSYLLDSRNRTTQIYVLLIHCVPILSWLNYTDLIAVWVLACLNH